MAKYVIKQENGDICLKPCKLLNKDVSTGKITPVTLSRMGSTIRWFSDFLTGTENNSYGPVIDGNTYQAYRDSGNVYLKETRGNIVNIVGFSSGEIQEVIKEFQQE